MVQATVTPSPVGPDLFGKDRRRQGGLTLSPGAGRIIPPTPTRDDRPMTTHYVEQSTAFIGVSRHELPRPALGLLAGGATRNRVLGR